MSEGSRSVAESTEVEPTEVAVRDEPQSMLALIDRYARDASVDVEKFERLLAMKERMEAREAETAFNEAKARIKAKLKDVRFTKTKSGPDNAYRYMPLDKMDEHVAPILAAESMDLSFTNELLPNGWLLIRGRLKHLPRGHYEDSTMPAPPDTVNKMKSAVQAIGSTNSFLRRYVTANIFNIVVIGDDDDGTGGPIDESQTKYLKDLIETLHKLDPAKDEAAFCKFMRVKSVAELPFIAYPKARSALEERIKKMVAANADSA